MQLVFQIIHQASASAGQCHVPKAGHRASPESTGVEAWGRVLHQDVPSRRRGSQVTVASTNVPDHHSRSPVGPIDLHVLCPSFQVAPHCDVNTGVPGTAARIGPIPFLPLFFNTNIKEAFKSPYLLWSPIKGNVTDTITVGGQGVDSAGQTHPHWVTGTLFNTSFSNKVWTLTLTPDSAPVQPGGLTLVNPSLGVDLLP